MDLVRGLLKAAAEAVGTFDALAVADAQHGPQEVGYHVEMMRDAGLVDATVRKAMGGAYVMARIDAITWEGNDFLDAVENDSVWMRVRTRVAQSAGSATFEVVKALAVSELSAMLGC